MDLRAFYISYSKNHVEKAYEVNQVLQLFVAPVELKNRITYDHFKLSSFILSLHKYENDRFQ